MAFATFVVRKGINSRRSGLNGSTISGIIITYGIMSIT